jgi:hypothetical protein
VTPVHAHRHYPGRNVRKVWLWWLGAGHRAFQKALGKSKAQLRKPSYFARSLSAFHNHKVWQVASIEKLPISRGSSKADPCVTGR